jgi:flavodoxin
MHSDLGMLCFVFIFILEKVAGHFLRFADGGTSEEYAIRIAKEAKSKLGLASLVCDPEEYNFKNLDQLPEGSAAIFAVATYGEGEPTDNAVQLTQNLTDKTFEFSDGSHRLEGLKYVVFGLGNKMYEHYNAIARIVGRELEKAGATGIGEHGEGDDDKSMREIILSGRTGCGTLLLRVWELRRARVVTPLILLSTSWNPTPKRKSTWVHPLSLPKPFNLLTNT